MIPHNRDNKQLFTSKHFSDRLRQHKKLVFCSMKQASGKNRWTKTNHTQRQDCIFTKLMCTREISKESINTFFNRKSISRNTSSVFKGILRDRPKWSLSQTR